ncbi:adenylyl-sulfate kinase [Fulvivirga sp.]|uniref:adenylyl-sulfate kinase n=1 Tax=Fulvivirga sp. TaxID=1931237 RepID=UPI0032EE6701
MTDNIFPIFDKSLSALEKEKGLDQKGLVIWMVGLSGSGKSTLATGLENRLHQNGFHTMLLDGDNLRSGINSNLGFSEDDRIENIRRAAEISKLFAFNGTITICSLISPTENIRKMAAEIIGDKYCEVFINCPIEVCEERDVKGLYAKARRGEIKNFTGIDSPFEIPKSPSIDVKTNEMTLESSLDYLYNSIIDKIKL